MAQDTARLVKDAVKSLLAAGDFAYMAWTESEAGKGME